MVLKPLAYKDRKASVASTVQLAFRRFDGRSGLEDEAVVLIVDRYRSTVGDLASQQFGCERILDLLLNHAFDGASSVGGIVALHGNRPGGSRCHNQCDAAIGKLLLQFRELQLHDSFDLIAP